MMYTVSDEMAAPSYEGSDSWWREKYPALRLLALRQIHRLHVPEWYGQEGELAEDAVQETARRMIERDQKAGRGEASAIQMYEQMVKTTICNYCKDMRRHDKRLVPLFYRDRSDEPCAVAGFDNAADTTEAIIDTVYQEQLFMLLATEISKFPAKQKHALLVDIANRMDFVGEPTPLQKAFLAVGIVLEEYQQPLPEDTKERGRIAALVYYAYKRLAENLAVRPYVAYS